VILIDTTIWSLALRRRRDDLSERERLLVGEWSRLVRRGQATLIGPIRQEILSGIKDERAFEAIRESLGDFRYLDIEPADYDTAAAFFNCCRSNGISGTSIDLLICAVAHRCGLPIFSTDPDFGHYAPHVGIHLHQLGSDSLD
jgi:predicted nucleic acid-binding protein